ncbi:predicted protein [Histoplasma mississippiense (nom. inval.)]|uniref:predicted protein n=1 Tax=Ajellomyces capsulatus (strain NAm1 / WU24) TaxID=2059318 RepID=UPI000157CDD5|nr:predicted protein [Histoplasma mississippiense (nom. inval.)]EDN10648.1 predicted protein [Histoplasma mississippiense (nom. inval.)]
MAAPAGTYKDRQFLAVIGDEDSVTGLLLAGIGIHQTHNETSSSSTRRQKPPSSKRPFTTSRRYARISECY